MLLRKRSGAECRNETPQRLPPVHDDPDYHAGKRRGPLLQRDVYKIGHAILNLNGF
jgi:hypothetical protein